MVDRTGAPFPLDVFRRGIDVNLVGLFDVLRLTATVMTRNEPGDDGERGLIVNIASIAGIEGQVGQASYAASKGGVIRSRCRSPATWRAGDRRDVHLPGGDGHGDARRSERRAAAALVDVNVFPKRLGRPDDVAGLVRTFMETTYLNGDVVRVDAGTRLAPR